MVIDTLEYIVKKYHLNTKYPSPIPIPNMGRDQLAELFAELNFNVGAEIGVEMGKYAAVLCHANPKLHLFCIDPWMAQVYDPGIHGIDSDQQKFDNNYQETLKRLAAFTCTILRKTSAEALSDVEDGKLDFVYIDGNHEFAHVAHDLWAWSKKVRRGGIISGHDYAHFPIAKRNHVKRVVDSFLTAYGIRPYFVVGADRVREAGIIRDAFRSWFWVKT